MKADGTLVLLYHRVADLARDPHDLAVHPDRFAQHCQILKQRFTVVPLRTVTRSFERAIAITFDDGYADNAAEARRILAAAGLPATFFITVGRLGLRREVWWDRLAQLLLLCETTSDAVEIELGGRPLWVDIRSAAGRERAHWALFWRLRPMRPSAIESVLDDLEGRLGVRSVDREAYRWMTSDELVALSRTGGVDIGGHTVTHPFLAALDPDEQRREIRGCRDSLEMMLGSAAHLFSYPYGGSDAIATVTPTLVRDAGFTMGCTTTGGLARADCDPFRLPRNVVGNWDASRFEQWLDGWFADN